MIITVNGYGHKTVKRIKRLLVKTFIIREWSGYNCYDHWTLLQNGYGYNENRKQIHFPLIVILTSDKSACFVFHWATFYNSYNLLTEILKRL